MEVGSYSIPDMRLEPSLVEAVKTMYNKLESNEVDFDTLAPILGHSTAKSGSFTAKMSFMRAYRLIDGRGKVRVTETGRKIAFPNPNKPEEANEGLIEAVTNIPLWKQLYEKYTKNAKDLPTSDFWLDIRQICAVSPEEAQNKAETVRKAYLEDIRHIKVQKAGDSGTMSGGQGGGQGAGGATLAPVVGEMISFEGGGLRLALPKDNLKEAWEKAKKMIDIYVGVK